jgi:hypothetical protein
MALTKDNLKHQSQKVAKNCDALVDMVKQFQDNFDPKTKASMTAVMAVLCSDIAYDAQTLKNMFKEEYNGK